MEWYNKAKSAAADLAQSTASAASELQRRAESAATDIANAAERVAENASDIVAESAADAGLVKKPAGASAGAQGQRPRRRVPPLYWGSASDSDIGRRIFAMGFPAARAAPGGGGPAP